MDFRVGRKKNGIHANAAINERMLIVIGAQKKRHSHECRFLQKRVAVCRRA